MLKSTETAVRAIIATDPSITPEQANGGIAVFKGEDIRPLLDNRKLESTLTLAQAAAAIGGRRTDKDGNPCGCCTKTVGQYVRRGRLVGVYGGATGRRLTGVVASSLRSFLDGKVVA